MKTTLKNASGKQNGTESHKVHMRFLKRKVAIARFSNETSYGRRGILGKKKKHYRRQASDILSARLAATNKFILLERMDTGSVIDESIRKLQNENAALYKKYGFFPPPWQREGILNERVRIIPAAQFSDGDDGEKKKKKKEKDDDTLYYESLMLSPSRKVLLGSIAHDFRKHIPADYLILGSISEFGRKVVGDVGLFSRSKKQVVRASVNIRLVDASTGQIVYSAEESGEASSEVATFLGIGGRAGYDASLNDMAVSAAISKLVKDIVKHMLDNPWRAYILGYEGNTYIMSGGKRQGIQIGDMFGAYSSGKKVINPQTGLFIELPGKLLGTVRVDKFIGSSKMDEVSLCSVTSGTLPKDDFSGLYIQELPAEDSKPDKTY